MKITLKNKLTAAELQQKAKMWNTGLCMAEKPLTMEIMSATADVQDDINRDGQGDYVALDEAKVANVGKAVVTGTLYPIAAEKLGTIAIAVYGRYGTLWLAPEEEVTLEVTDDLAIKYYKGLASDVIGVTTDEAA